VIRFLQHILSPAYLYALADHPYGLTPKRLAIAGIFWAMSALCWCWRRRLSDGPRPVPLGVSSALFGMAGLLYVLHLVTVGVFSARVWYLSALMAGLAVLFGKLCLRSVESMQLIEKAGDRRVECRSCILFLHLVGLWILQAREGLGGSAAFALAVAIIGGIISRWLHRISFREALLKSLHCAAPLFLVYMGCGLRWLVGDVLGVNVADYEAFAYPDLWSIWFIPQVTCCAGILWTLWRVGVQALGARRVVYALCLSVLGWYALVIGVHYTHGTTGSDPYCYAQMAIDLTRKGTPLHAFPLAELARRAGVPVWPIVHVGYHSPAGLRAPTVWPPWWSVLLVPFYVLGGEQGLSFGAPLFLGLAAWATWRFSKAFGSGTGQGVGAATAFALTLTSREAVLRSLVPMADAAAMAFTVFTVWLLVEVRRRDCLRTSALAGLALAACYLVRHPQLPLVIAAVPAFALAPWSRLRRIEHLAVFALVALVGALPDLWYHTTVFGSPWATESQEWFLISWRNLSTTWGRLVADGLLRRNEFGFLWPLIAWGAFSQWTHKRERVEALILSTSVIAVLLFHLCYRALRWRDLIPLFPCFAIWAGRGVEAALTWGKSGAGKKSFLVAVLVLMLAARTVSTFALPLQPRVQVFGHLSATEKRAFAELAALLDADALVFTGINSGAVERYANVMTARPAYWNKAQRRVFVEAARREHTLYLLDDGEEMELVLRDLATTYELVEQARIAIPTFGVGGQAWGRPAVLYKIMD